MDGVPNVEPPEPIKLCYSGTLIHMTLLRSRGFANLNSELLLNISNISGGDGYSFIPDSINPRFSIH